MVGRGGARAFFLAAAILAAPAALAAPGRDLVLEAELEPARVYVQAQALYRLRLYQGVDVQGVSFNVAPLRLADLRPVDQGRVYETVREGRRYRVHERSYAINPFASGVIELGGTHVLGQIPSTDADAVDGRRAVRVEAPSRTLTVFPMPPGAGAPWLPARTVHVSETWDTTVSRPQVGQAQRRSIRVEAAGVDAAQLPPLQIEVPGMAVHAEPARLENRFAGNINIGVREQSFKMVPLRAGKIAVPALQLHWWNVQTNLPATATVPLRTLVVAPALALAPPPGRAPSAAHAAPIVAPPQRAPRGSSLLAVMAALLCALALLWYRRAAVLAAWRLSRACRAGDARGVRDALLAWAATRSPQGPVLTLGALADCLREPEARRALGELERHLYGAAPGACDAAALTAAVRNVRRAVRQRGRAVCRAAAAH